MRILIVHNILNDSGSVSGVLTEYVHMANAWIEAGHQTDFLVAKAGWPQFQKLAPRARLISSDNLFNATRYLAKSWRYLPAYAYRLLTAHWVRLPDRYDVIYASSQFVIETYAARVIARRQRAKLVAKVQHVLFGEKARTGFFDRLFLWAERQSARWMNREADLLLALSSTVAERYHALERSLGLRPREIATSGCGIDVARFSAVATLPKRFDVVVLGRLHVQKGIEELPGVWQAVIREIPGAQLVVIGEGPHRQRTEAAFAQLGLAESVRFTGAVSESEKNRLVGESRVGLSLSYEEGWGLSITEFLATGLPVVAYDLPVFAEVFPGQLQIVQPHDQKGAARRLVDLLQNEVTREALGQKGRTFAQQYDYRVMAQRELSKLQAIFSPGTATGS